MQTKEKNDAEQERKKKTRRMVFSSVYIDDHTYITCLMRLTQRKLTYNRKQWHSRRWVLCEWTNADRRREREREKYSHCFKTINDVRAFLLSMTISVDRLFSSLNSIYQDESILRWIMCLMDSDWRECDWLNCSSMNNYSWQDCIHKSMRMKTND
jgi:hypothetical protein